MENLKAETRAGVLVEALPYLQEYNGKIVVVSTAETHDQRGFKAGGHP